MSKTFAELGLSEATLQALRDVGYAGWVSVEMKPAGLDAVRAAAELVARVN